MPEGASRSEVVAAEEVERPNEDAIGGRGILRGPFDCLRLCLEVGGAQRARWLGHRRTHLYHEEANRIVTIS
jgi:hypothetical protein